MSLADGPWTVGRHRLHLQHSYLLAELIPAKVRYTAMSMAFNPGIGFFGGFTPLIIQAIGLWLKNPLAGVILHTYVVAAVALLTALLPLPETKDKTLD